MKIILIIITTTKEDKVVRKSSTKLCLCLSFNMKPRALKPDHVAKRSAFDGG